MTDDLAKEKTVIKKDVPRATRLGRYTLGKRLGVGGMAEVYLAEQDGPQQFRKRVVVKRILPALAADPQFVQMFVREAQVAARLAHGNVVQILELGEQSDGAQTEYFIAMEYIDGLTLQRLAQSSWDQGKAVPVDVVLRACADAARGLHAAHTLTDERGKLAGLVHRDISPDNLMVSRDGVTKVLDFGIAKGELGGPKTKTGNVRGKIPYMSPEQVTGQALDARTDLYALGVSMYYLLCGERPFDRGTDYHTMQAVLTEPPKPPRMLNPGISEPLEQLMLALLDKDRTKRPQHAADLADDLEALTQPGTGAGRKTMIAFVGAMIDAAAGAGNPLSEADGARATVPLEVAGALVDVTAVAGDPAAANAPPPELSIEIAETHVPRRITLTGPAAPPELAAAATGVPTETQTAPERAASKPGGAPLATGVVATRAAPAPAPAPPPPPRAVPVVGSADNHPVVDLLAPRREGVPAWAALLAVLVGMAVVGAGVTFVAFKIAAQKPSGPADVAAADAGVAQPVMAADIVDAGALVAAAPADAGAVAVRVDAGTAAPHAVPVPIVDAGPPAGASLDAGIGAPKPVRLVVKATAPGSIRWELPDGGAVGRGSGALSLPRGTRELVARDTGRQRADTLAIALDPANPLKGSVDYTPLLTATLAVTNVGDARVMFGDDDVSKTGNARAVPGAYNLRIFVGEERYSVRITLRQGQTTTVDVQKEIKKKAR